MTAAGMPNHGIESDGCYAAAPDAKRWTASAEFDLGSLNNR
jgi:hypothetical protein